MSYNTPDDLPGLTRREFLSRTAQSGLAIPALSAAFAAGAPSTQSTGGSSLESLRQLFAKPPDAAKPMTRWWWFAAVTPEEITRELTFMRDAGLRGAEIQPVYPVTTDDPSRGVRNLRYYSPEWWDVVRHTVREAKRLGLQLDFTLGSGWPYGGPFVTPDLGARRLRALSQDLTGPRPFSWNLGPLTVGEDRIVAAVIAPVRDDGSPDLAKALAVPRPPAPDAGQPRAGLLDALDVPPGRWRVTVFLDTPTGMQVKRPTLGMEGLVIDHHNRDAIDLFLRAAGDRVFDAIGTADGPPFHSVFCDSLEVYGADWTRRLIEAFEKRRGYDLTPYLPALFSDAGPITPHVRYDYHLTLSDLIIDEFFEPLVAWSEKRGVQARIQAHGAMGDVMRGYGLAHIPEGENIFLGDRYQVNVKHRRLASSAAHVYGKRLVSAETYTWLRTPLFTTTLEMMKAATDSTLLDGINHIVNHGYSYSPPEAGEPGWAFYASTEANHTQTWWRHYPHLARYVQRACALLREGASVNPILVYLPMADVYAEYGAGSLHLDVEIAARFDPVLFDALRQAGYDFDLVNDHGLVERLKVDAGVLRAASAGAYKVMIVANARYMPPESAAQIGAFVRAGGHLIAIGSLPQEAPGVQQRDVRTTALREVWTSLWGSLPASAPAPAARHSAVLVADVRDALNRLNAVLTPDFRIVQAGAGTPANLQTAREHVGFTHRRVDDADCYFVANVSAEPRLLRVQAACGHRAPQRWNIETGEEQRELAYDYLFLDRGDRVTEVELALEPFESCFLVFGSSTTAPAVKATDPRGTWMLARDGTGIELRGLAPASGTYQFQLANGRPRPVTVNRVPAPIVVDGAWGLTLGGRQPVRLDRLRSWDELPEGKGFSGWGTYEIDLDVPDLERDVEWLVDLGRVHETAAVSLNGRALGAAWKGTRRLSCGDALVRGRNRLTVDVANLWIHHVLAHRPGDPARHLRGVGPDPQLAETMGIRWGTYGEVPPDHVPPAGLLGPVRLVPMKRVRVRL
jgi:hypothetical protein